MVSAEQRANAVAQSQAQAKADDARNAGIQANIDNANSNFRNPSETQSSYSYDVNGNPIEVTPQPRTNPDGTIIQTQGNKSYVVKLNENMGIGDNLSEITKKETALNYVAGTSGAGVHRQVNLVEQLSVQDTQNKIDVVSRKQKEMQAYIEKKQAELDAEKQRQRDLQNNIKKTSNKISEISNAPVTPTNPYSHRDKNTGRLVESNEAHNILIARSKEIEPLQNDVKITTTQLKQSETRATQLENTVAFFEKQLEKVKREDYKKTQYNLGKGTETAPAQAPPPRTKSVNTGVAVSSMVAGTGVLAEIARQGASLLGLDKQQPPKPEPKHHSVNLTESMIVGEGTPKEQPTPKGFERLANMKPDLDANKKYIDENLKIAPESNYDIFLNRISPFDQLMEGRKAIFENLGTLGVEGAKEVSRNIDGKKITENQSPRLKPDIVNDAISAFIKPMQEKDTTPINYAGKVATNLDEVSKFAKEHPYTAFGNVESNVGIAIASLGAGEGASIIARNVKGYQSATKVSKFVNEYFPPETVTQKTTKYTPKELTPTEQANLNNLNVKLEKGKVSFEDYAKQYTENFLQKTETKTKTPAKESITTEKIIMNEKPTPAQKKIIDKLNADLDSGKITPQEYANQKTANNLGWSQVIKTKEYVKPTVRGFERIADDKAGNPRYDLEFTDKNGRYAGGVVTVAPKNILFEGYKMVQNPKTNPIDIANQNIAVPPQAPTLRFTSEVGQRILKAPKGFQQKALEIWARRVEYDTKGEQIQFAEIVDPVAYKQTAMPEGFANIRDMINESNKVKGYLLADVETGNIRVVDASVINFGASRGVKVMTGEAFLETDIAPLTKSYPNIMRDLQINPEMKNPIKPAFESQYSIDYTFYSDILGKTTKFKPKDDPSLQQVFGGDDLLFNDMVKQFAKDSNAPRPYKPMQPFKEDFEINADLGNVGNQGKPKPISQEKPNDTFELPKETKRELLSGFEQQTQSQTPAQMFGYDTSQGNDFGFQMHEPTKKEREELKRFFGVKDEFDFTNDFDVDVTPAYKNKIITPLKDKTGNKLIQFNIQQIDIDVMPKYDDGFKFDTIPKITPIYTPNIDTTPMMDIGITPKYDIGIIQDQLELTVTKTPPPITDEPPFPDDTTFRNPPSVPFGFPKGIGMMGWVNSFHSAKPKDRFWDANPDEALGFFKTKTGLGYQDKEFKEITHPSKKSKKNNILGIDLNFEF